MMESDLFVGLRNMLLIQIMIMPFILFQDPSVCVPRSFLNGWARYTSWKLRRRNNEAGDTPGKFCEIDMSKLK